MAWETHPRILYRLAKFADFDDTVAGEVPAGWLDPAIESALLLGMLGTMSGMVSGFVGLSPDELEQDPFSTLNAVNEFKFQIYSIHFLELLAESLFEYITSTQKGRGKPHRAFLLCLGNNLIKGLAESGGRRFHFCQTASYKKYHNS